MTLSQLFTMKKFSNQFFTLLLVLLSVGAFDLHAILDHTTRSAPNVWPAASAAPLYSTSNTAELNTRSRKPRVGIVIKNASTFKKAPKKTITTGGSKSSSSAFDSPDGRVSMKVQLKMLERNQDADPLMVSRLNSILFYLERDGLTR